jgi:hypothetical protein
VLAFALTVTDAGGLSDVATTTVSIRPNCLYLPLVTRSDP